MFPTEPGLYFVQGKNCLEPRLGSNGSGKSTFLDAVYWCLYGKTLRGLRAADVITRGERHTSVELTIEVGDSTHVILREQSPNKLTLDGVAVEQDVIVKAVRLTELTFVYSVILPQFGDSFFELKATEKLNLFSDILNLEYWLDKSRAANALTNDIDIELGRLEQKTENAELACEAWKEEISSLSAKESTYDKEREEVIIKLRGQLAELRAKMQASKEEMTSAGKQIRVLNEIKEDKIDTLSRLNAKKTDYLKQREEQAGDKAYIKSNMELAEETLKKIKGLSAVCPTCLQKVDAQHIKKERLALSAKINMLKVELLDLEMESVSSKKFLNKLWTDISGADEDLKAISDKISDFAQKQAAALAALELGSKQDVSLIEAIGTEKNRANPYTKMLIEKRAKLAETQAEIVRLEKDFEIIQAKHEATYYWIQGFKRVRLFLIEETLKTFEIEVNSSLVSLGLDDWTIHFDVERENKSGGMTKGFTVIIKNRQQGGSFKLEEWSGGEGQRIQQAGDLGLANLIMHQAGLDNKFEAYDEPSSSLSNEGLQDLAETLHQRAINDGKVIFLIDHHAIEFGEFAGIIHVTKGENGSVISSLQNS